MGLTFTMMTSPTSEVSGIAVDRAGRPVPGALVALDASWPLFGGPRGSSQTDAEGRFRIGFIAPGEYRLTMKLPDTEPSPVTRQTPLVRITVVDADVSSLTIRFR
jgi:hypothetical protein